MNEKSLKFSPVGTIFKFTCPTKSVKKAVVANLHILVVSPDKFLLTRVLIFSNLVRSCCCCCSAYLSSCHRTASDANLLDDSHTFHYNDYFVIRGIRTCLGVSDNPMFLWISSNSCPLNLLLVRSHLAGIIILKHLIQGRNKVTRVWVEPRSVVASGTATAP